MLLPLTLTWPQQQHGRRDVTCKPAMVDKLIQQEKLNRFNGCAKRQPKTPYSPFLVRCFSPCTCAFQCA